VFARKDLIESMVFALSVPILTSMTAYLVDVCSNVIRMKLLSMDFANALLVFSR
jgi:hypothetical protein